MKEDFLSFEKKEVSNFMTPEEIREQYSNFIIQRTYTRYNEKLKRRETWDEAVDRYAEFLKDEYPEQLVKGELEKEFEEAIQAIKEKKVMPSMRLLWTAGKAAKKDPICAYNCSYTAIDSIKVFSEIMYLLMNGVGVGFSVERQYIQKLPEVSSESYPEQAQCYIVEDSKEGWSLTYKSLIRDWYHGIPSIWDVSKIRSKGSIIKTFGGRASGPEVLVDLFNFTKNIIQYAKGRKLNSKELTDIVCKIADIVIAGGVRRSACIAFTNLSDQRMKHYKEGQFWLDNPQRVLANISIAYTEKPEPVYFMDEWKQLILSGSGERGIINTAIFPDPDMRTNPCAERVLINKNLCNLSEVVIDKNITIEEIKRRIKLATLLGTIQATLTKFNTKILSKDWIKNTEKEAQIGVSLTGTSNKNWTSEELELLKKYSFEYNEKYAKIFNINKASGITCNKPSGCLKFDTLIKTNLGIKSFKELAEYFEIKKLESLPENTFYDVSKYNVYVYDMDNEKQLITKFYINGIKKTKKITLEDNLIIECTFNHKFFLVNKGWTEASKLTSNDKIWNWEEDGKFYFKKIVKIEDGKKQFTVDIEVDNTHSYQLANGCISHNTVSQVVGTPSGIHPDYAPFYIRRIRVSRADPICTLLVAEGVPFQPEVGTTLENANTFVFEFPLKSSSLRLRENCSAIEQLKYYKLFKKYWCDERGNPSCTIYVKEHEWLEVLNWVYTNWDHIGGVSFLPYDNGVYQLAPYEEISEEKFNELCEKFPKIDFNKLSFYELEDRTEGAANLACSAGSCELR